MTDHYAEQREADEIWKNAPSTATHYGGGKYWRIQDGGDGWEAECAFQWVHSSGSPFAFKDFDRRPENSTKPSPIAQDAPKPQNPYQRTIIGLDGSKCVVDADPVNHPKHYAIAPGVEAIDIIKASLTPEQFEGYLLGNFLKYRLRAGDKDDLQQDIAKSNFYKKMLNSK